MDRAAHTIHSPIKERENGIQTYRDIDLSGGECFIESGCRKLETGTKLKISIEFKEIVPNRIIMEADAPYGTYDIRINENGRLGFYGRGIFLRIQLYSRSKQRLNLTIETKPLEQSLK